LHAGGAEGVEFTNRGDGAVDVFRELIAACRHELPDLAVGVGSVSDAPTAALYVNLGADFVVGPTLDPATARLCNGRKVAYLPGCATPSEIEQAEELGCELVKLLPGAAAGGPGFVEAVRGPRPWTWLVPTGGVEPTEESMRAWFEAGVAAVGIGSKLVRADLVEAKAWDELSELVRAALEHVARWSMWRHEAR
jgi:2-dehydro-3-deoxyphosphogluconate aldolase/(4S)-4-hydroxy-2-oxoglutarate aldolase